MSYIGVEVAIIKIKDEFKEDFENLYYFGG